MTELSRGGRRVQEALEALGLACRVVELPASTRTAPEAAAAVGCDVAQICKSLVFRAAGGAPILVIASGANRVDERRLVALVGEPVGKADPAFVREHTGYPIGGVAPVGHPAPLRTFIDADLLRYDRVWAAAGTPNGVFELDPRDLERVTGGAIVEIR